MITKALIIISFGLQLFVAGQVDAFEKIVVVVKADNPVESMTRSEVIDLFMGKYVAFPNGEKAIAADLDGEQATKEVFYRQLVGRSLASVNSYWSRIRFAGRQRASIQHSSEQDVIDFIENNDLAIGYVPLSMVSNNLKVVYELDE